MKQKDILTLGVIVIVSVVLSVLLSGRIFSSKKVLAQQVEVVPPISANFPTPSSQYFNNQSIDPTQLIQIGNNNNTSPFNAPAQ